MKYFRLNNGVQIPAIGYGTYMTSPRVTKEQVTNALNAGYRLIDTAQYYGNERQVGAAVNQSGIPRDQIFVTSKTDTGGYQATKTGIDESLRRAKLDYFDLMIIHWPTGSDRSDLESYRALEEAYQAGKLRAIGLSNFNHQQVQGIIDNSSVVPAVDQIQTHLTWQQWGMHQYLTAHHILHESWAPLGEGENNQLANPTLVRIGQKYGKSTAQVMMRFFVQSHILAIPKTTNPKHLKENIDVFDFNLSDEDIEAIKKEDRRQGVDDWPFSMLIEQNY